VLPSLKLERSSSAPFEADLARVGFFSARKKYSFHHGDTESTERNQIHFTAESAEGRREREKKEKIEFVFLCGPLRSLR
jgi:hypothetical protein